MLVRTLKRKEVCSNILSPFKTGKKRGSSPKANVRAKKQKSYAINRVHETEPRSSPRGREIEKRREKKKGRGRIETRKEARLFSRQVKNNTKFRESLTGERHHDRRVAHTKQMHAIHMIRMINRELYWHDMYDIREYRHHPSQVSGIALHCIA